MNWLDKVCQTKMGREQLRELVRRVAASQNKRHYPACFGIPTAINYLQYRTALLNDVHFAIHDDNDRTYARMKLKELRVIPACNGVFYLP